MAVLHVCLLTLLMAIDEPQASTPVELAPEAIAIAIEQLGSPNFEVRQRATSFLWQAGAVTEPALRQALDSPQPEVRIRARSILDDFRHGIFADTPAEVVILLRRFRSEEGTNREPTWAQLVNRAPTETLIALAELEPTVGRLQSVLNRLAKDEQVLRAVELAENWRQKFSTAREIAKLDDFIRQQIPFFLAQQDYARTERLLEQAAVDDPGIRNWAVYLLLREQLDDKIRDLKEELPKVRDDAEQANLAYTKLTYMLRVAGDLEGARTMAEQVRDPGQALLRSILFDLRAWDELAVLQAQRLANDGQSIEELSFAAAYCRLADRQDEFAQHMAAIRQQAERIGSGQKLGYCREALYLNGRTNEAIQLLAREDPIEAFSVQLLRHHYAAALETAGIGLTRESREMWFQGVMDGQDGSQNAQRNYRIAIRLAQLLASVGEKQEASETFARLALAAKDDRDGAQLREVAEFELRAGLTNEAFEHAAQAFDKDSGIAAVELLFIRHRTPASTWWELYKEWAPADSTRSRLASLRKLFYQGKNDEALLDQLTSAFAWTRSLPIQHTSRAKWLNVLGETCLLREQKELARQCFESVAADYPTAAMHLADLARADREWSSAADWYRAAWEKGRLTHALYLHGEMLVQAGENEAGEQARQLARLIPLATAARHDGLATGLAQRGYRAEAEREWELLRRCSTWSEAQMFHAVGSLGDAAQAQQPLVAANLWEQRMLNCLQENWFFTDQASYVRIPHQVHRARAKGLFDGEKVEEAIDELRMCLIIWPADLNVAEEFVPKLDQAQQREFADELFGRAYQGVEEICRLFPKSALHHNNLAWLAARCQRRLDEALIHINLALELAPNSAQYLDTLAEVYFQQGHVDRAIETAKRCIELDPDNAFYQEQLQRFLAAKQQPQ